MVTLPSGAPWAGDSLIAPASPTHYTDTILPSRTSLRPSSYPPRCFPQLKIVQLPKRHTCRRDAAAGALTAGRGSAELVLSRYLRPPPPRAELRLGKNQKQLGGFPAPEAGVGVLRREWKPWCLLSPSLSSLLLSTTRWSSLSPAEPGGWVWEVGKKWGGVVG